MRHQKQEPDAGERFQTREVNREEFMELASEHKAGRIYMFGMESGTSFGRRMPWLWRVSFEVLSDKKKELIQVELI